MTIQKNLYELPECYDVLFSYRDFRSDAAFLREQCRTHLGREPASVVDFACGAANHLGVLSETCNECFGIDSSPSMIEYARAKYPDLTLKVASFLDASPVETTVDLAICLLESFCYIYDYEQLERHLQMVHDTLTEGGIYVVECANPAESVRSIDCEPSDPISWSMTSENTRYETRWSLRETDPIAQIDTISVSVSKIAADRTTDYEESLRHRFWLANELELFLGKYFTICGRHGALDAEAPFSAPAEKLVYVLQRR
jgi:SAM-dependent methyltransferase